MLLCFCELNGLKPRRGVGRGQDQLCRRLFGVVALFAPSFRRAEAGFIPSIEGS